MKKFIPYIIIVIIALAITMCTLTISAPSEYKSQYTCDVKLISLDMNVDIDDANGNYCYNINGEIFAAYEDDLTMKNKDGDIVKTTDDKYNFITQNEHVIMNGDDVAYICDGKIKLFADSYDVFDADGNKIAYVKFNMFDTAGIMIDMDGNEIARYDSALSRYDYVVSIFDACKIDDESVLMIFASYFSDVRADSA